MRGRHARGSRCASEERPEPITAKRSDVRATHGPGGRPRAQDRRDSRGEGGGGPSPPRPLGLAAGAWRLRARAHSEIARTTRAGQGVAPNRNWPNRNRQNAATPRVAGIQGSRDPGIKGSRDPGIEGSRGQGIKESRDQGIKGSSGTATSRSEQEKRHFRPQQKDEKKPALCDPRSRIGRGSLR